MGDVILCEPGQTTTSGFLVAGFFIAMTTAGVFTLAVGGIWVPFGWQRVLAVGGAIPELFLMTTFFGPTQLLPMALELAVLWAAKTNWRQPTVGWRSLA